MKKQSPRHRLFLYLFGFVGAGALEIAMHLDTVPHVIGATLIILSVLAIASLINTDNWRPRAKRLLLVSSATIPAVIILRSYIENKSLLDSAIFVAAVMIIVGGVLYATCIGLPRHQKQNS